MPRSAAVIRATLPRLAGAIVLSAAACGRMPTRVDGDGFSVQSTKAGIRVVNAGPTPLFFAVLPLDGRGFARTPYCLGEPQCPGLAPGADTTDRWEDIPASSGGREYSVELWRAGMDAQGRPVVASLVDVVVAR